jgi:hypothetical protein
MPYSIDANWLQICTVRVRSNSWSVLTPTFLSDLHCTVWLLVAGDMQHKHLKRNPETSWEHMSFCQLVNSASEHLWPWEASPSVLQMLFLAPKEAILFSGIWSKGIWTIICSHSKTHRKKADTGVAIQSYSSRYMVISCCLKYRRSSSSTSTKLR